MSKAIAALVRLGLESQENRKREFFNKLEENLSNDDPNQQDRLVDEFRTSRSRTPVPEHISVGRTSRARQALVKLET